MPPSPASPADALASPPPLPAGPTFSRTGFRASGSSARVRPHSSSPSSTSNGRSGAIQSLRAAKGGADFEAQNSIVGEAQNSTVGPSGKDVLPPAPWAFGFQCNERYLEWDAAAQARLAQLVASQELGVTVKELGDRLARVATLVPDLAPRLGRMQAGLLARLAGDTQAVAERMVAIKSALPDLDASSLAARYPALVAEFSPEEIGRRVRGVRRAVGQRAVEMIEREPRVVGVDVGQVLAEVARLRPGREPVAELLAAPELFLSMEQQGMPSAIDMGNEC